MPRYKAGIETRLFHLNPLFQFFKPGQDNVDSPWTFTCGCSAGFFHHY